MKSLLNINNSRRKGAKNIAGECICAFLRQRAKQKPLRFEKEAEITGGKEKLKFNSELQVQSRFLPWRNIFKYIFLKNVIY